MKVLVEKVKGGFILTREDGVRSVTSESLYSLSSVLEDIFEEIEHQSAQQMAAAQQPMKVAQAGEVCWGSQADEVRGPYTLSPQFP